MTERTNHHKLPKTATLLKIAAICVAAPRYMGAFGAAIGIDVLANYAWLEQAEVYSGGAMALLEGIALAFVASKWRLLKPQSIHWWIMLVMMGLLAIALPLVAAPYMLIAQDGISAQDLFAQYFLLRAAWTFIIAATPVLVVLAVGVADVDELEISEAEAGKAAKLEQLKRQTRQARQATFEQTRQADQVACEQCLRVFGSKRALNGHLAHCKANSSNLLPARVGEPEHSHNGQG